jgi:choice-of-anchor B domain-containing protein
MKKVYVIMVMIILSTAAYSQQSSNVTLLSNLNPHPSGRYSDCWGYTDSLGREYALIGAALGTSIIEITDPANPVERAFIPGPESNWRDIKTHSHYAYVVTEGTGPDEGMQIIDLSDLPDTAVLVNTITEWFETAHNLYIDSAFAYVVGDRDSGGMHILDLADPVNPERTYYYTTRNMIHDVYVWNDTAYISPGATYDMIDLTDKYAPKLVSKTEIIDSIYAHSGWLTEDKRYFIACEEKNVRDIMVFDLQDRLNWQMVVPSFQMPGKSPVHNVFVKGDYAHVAYYADGYVVLDVSDLPNLSVAGFYDTHPDTSSTFAGVWGVYPFYPSGVVIASDIRNGLYVFDFVGDGITSAEETSGIPVSFNLKQNYPNPFNPATTIEFEIAEQSFVKLSIFNALGEEVSLLINNNMNPGTHKAAFDAGNLPSGIYFAKLQAGDKFRIIKMSLMK